MKKSIRRFLDQLLFIDRWLIKSTIKKYQRIFKGKLLDVGCGEGPYRREFENISQYTGLDVSGMADIKHDIDKIPFPINNGEYDSVICTQVLDDVNDPDLFLSELNRILAKKGKLLLSCSFVWEIHDEPNDYFRPTKYWLKKHLADAGFKVGKVIELGNRFDVLGQVINMTIYGYIYRFGVFKYLLIVNSIFFRLLAVIFSSEMNRKLPLGYFVIAEKKAK